MAKKKTDWEFIKSFCKVHSGEYPKGAILFYSKGFTILGEINVAEMQDTVYSLVVRTHAEQALKSTAKKKSQKKIEEA